MSAILGGERLVPLFDGNAVIDRLREMGKDTDGDDVSDVLDAVVALIKEEERKRTQ
jgi:hypothetical protein